MALWFGKSGLMSIFPDPDRDVGLSPVRATAEHGLLGGGRVIDVIGTPRRVYTMKWTALTTDETHLIESYVDGHNGLGPWRLIPCDVPGWNFLDPLVASATSQTGDTAGWSTDPGDTLLSVSTPVLRGPRSLSWQALADAGNDRWLWTSGPRSSAPIGGTGTWTFTYNARTQSGTATAFAQLWGSTALDGPDTALNSAGWTQVSVTYAPPAGDMEIFIGLRPGPTVTVFIDTPRLTFTPGPVPWTPGRGVPLVTISDVQTTARWVDSYDMTLTLREVG